MNLNCKLIEKTFIDKENVIRKYYVLQFELADNSPLEVTLKGDKAKLLIMSHSFVSRKAAELPDVPFFSQDEVSSLNN